VSEAATFLAALSQALATMMLYAAGHPARERAIEGAYRALEDLRRSLPAPSFTFLGEEVVVGRTPLREMKGWEWSSRLADAGIQRIEFDRPLTTDDFGVFLDEVVARLTATSSTEARQMRELPVRFGTVGVKGETREAAVRRTISGLTLNVEADTVRWLHDELRSAESLHLAEAEAVVRSLSVAMHSDQKLLIPLLRLRRFDEYTTTHALNVAVLAMAFAEYLGLSPRDIRNFGVAGLLHDIGKIHIPLEILTKPGKLTPEERAVMNRHPSDGARMLLESLDPLDLAAVVAYEHHIMIDGGGYPDLHFRRDCHYASRIVHLCDVYDALRTHRPYREAWQPQRVLDYISERAGTEFDQDLAESFVRMMYKWEPTLIEGDAEEEAPTPDLPPMEGMAPAATDLPPTEGTAPAATDLPPAEGTAPAATDGAPPGAQPPVPAPAREAPPPTGGDGAAGDGSASE
jgi:putative nucleotidyltransferase with HDIG domain